MSQHDTPDWFPFYVYVFLGDELVQAMTPEQIGCYTLLLCAQWINGSIPGDIPTLARMCRGRTTAEMEIIWRGIGPCFTEIDGRFYQKRLAEERVKAIKRLAGNKRGGVSRQVEAKSKSGQVQVDSARPLCSVSVNTSKEETTKILEVTARCAEFANTYPAHRLNDLGAQYFAGLTDERQTIALSNLREMVKSDEWMQDGGRFVPWASEWISTGKFVAKPKVRPAQESTMDPETRRRIQEARRG